MSYFWPSSADKQAPRRRHSPYIRPLLPRAAHVETLSDTWARHGTSWNAFPCDASMMYLYSGEVACSGSLQILQDLSEICVQLFHVFS